MSVDILKVLDSIIEKTIEQLPSLLEKKVEKLLGGKTALLTLDVDSKKLNEKAFDEMYGIIYDTVNQLNDKIITIVEKFFKENGVFIPKDELSEFYLEIKNNIKTFMNFIPNNIRQDVLSSVASTLTDTKVKDAAKSLSGKIGKSVKQSMLIINETIAQRVREKNYTTLKKISTKKTKWKFVHVKDSKNSPFCKKHGNAVHTEEEWIDIKSDIFIEGGHIGCRGIMVIDYSEEDDTIADDDK